MVEQKLIKEMKRKKGKYSVTDDEERSFPDAGGGSEGNSALVINRRIVNQIMIVIIIIIIMVDFVFGLICKFFTFGFHFPGRLGPIIKRRKEKRVRSKWEWR